MARKIPVLVDEDLYYLLQEMRTPPTNDVSDVIRQLFFVAAGQLHAEQETLNREIKLRIGVAEVRSAPVQIKRAG